jgi:formylglycine-generating enzyme required for sulfatase activity
VALIPAACAANLDGFSSPSATVPDSASPEAAPSPVDANPVAAEAAAVDAADAGVDANDGGCKGTAGPAMVRLGAYCIDLTEVTAAQYSEFLATPPSLANQPAACAFNASYLPAQTVQSDNFPARYVDWCDAHAYCAWAGKHLCGAIGGGPASFTNYAAVTDEWYSACSNVGKLAYPYGQTYQPLACNGSDWNDAGEVIAVGSLATCVGPQPGLVDLSGNAREWQDACDPNLQGGAEECVTRGGGADDPELNLGCGSHQKDARNYNSKHLGFRCCSD